MLVGKLNMIFTSDEMARLNVNNSMDGSIQIIVDVHGMKCCQVRRFINNIINIVRETFRLIIIHGYNHGTAIKEMLNQNFSNPHIRKQYNDLYNQGITHMLIVA